MATEAELIVRTLDRHLSGPTDIIVSKLARADELDLQDILWLVDHEHLTAAQVWSEVDQAEVPPILAEAFAQARGRLARVLPRP